MNKRQLKYAANRFFLLYLPLAVFLIFTLFPFYWIVNTSLKDSTEVLAIPIKYWPSHRRWKIMWNCSRSSASAETS